MIFQEKKTANEWHYHTEDVWGIIDITAKRKLAPQELDNIVLYALKVGSSHGEIKDVGTYTLQKQSEWLQDENNE